ncbi:hypothetical protein ABEDC_1066 [Acinetobacter lwoffii]|nr:hypothetical protein ABEDC_1066 [Acinetobacter lwoffii]
MATGPFSFDTEVPDKIIPFEILRFLKGIILFKDLSPVSMFLIDKNLFDWN